MIMQTVINASNYFPTWVVCRYIDNYEQNRLKHFGAE